MTSFHKGVLSSTFAHAQSAEYHTDGKVTFPQKTLSGMDNLMSRNAEQTVSADVNQNLNNKFTI
jgi:hypothetical protein